MYFFSKFFILVKCFLQKRIYLQKSQESFFPKGIYEQILKYIHKNFFKQKICTRIFPFFLNGLDFACVGNQMSKCK